MFICDFIGSRVIGKPKDWDDDLDGECVNLFVADAVDHLSGFPIMFSVYRPTPDDLIALNQGGAIRLGVVGVTHPVVQLAVIGPQLCEKAQLIEKYDLGPVVEILT